MAATRPWLHVLHRPGKDGLGNAYRAGFAWALENGYVAIAQLDADLSHPPSILPSDARGARARSRPRARLALRAGRRQRRLAAAPPAREPARMRALGARPRPALHGSLGRASSCGGHQRWSRSTSHPRAPRATSSRSRRRSARTAPACASSSCRSRSAIARPASRRCAPRSRSRACAWSRACAATAGSLSASRPRPAPARSRRRPTAAKRWIAPSSSAARPSSLRAEVRQRRS